jgi:parallel beta-helix repeat protein
LSVFVFCAVQGAFASSYSAWVTQQGLEGPWALSTAVVASDGLQNQIKYALGLNAATDYNPGSPSLPQVQPTTVSGSSYLALSFNGAATDVTYRVLATSTLTGTWTTIYTSTSGEAPGATTVQDTQPMSASNQRYMRLQVTLPAQAVDTSGLWVDQTAPPGGTGSYASPFQTINQALTKAESKGDTDMQITIRAGTYHEFICIRGDQGARSGTAGNPFIIRGMPGERVVISGMKPITGWTSYSGNIYVANLGTWNSAQYKPAGPFPDSFFVGNNERLMAQLPSPGTGCWHFDTTQTTLTGTNTTITDTVNLVGVGNLAGGSVQFYGQSNGLWSAPILSNDPVGGTLTYQGSSLNTGQDGSYIIKNCLQCLKQPGEWAVIPQTGGTYLMYYWPKNAAEVSNLLSATPTTQARASYDTSGTILPTDGLQSMVVLYGLSYATVEGLEVTGAAGGGNGIYAESCQNLNLQWNVLHDNCGVVFSGTTPGSTGGYGVSLRNCTDCTISNNNITLNHSGVFLYSCATCTITQNDIGCPYNDGIDVGSADATEPTPNDVISNNYIHHVNDFQTHPDGIQTYDDQVTNLGILDNLILGIAQNNDNGMGGGTIAGNVYWPCGPHNLADNGKWPLTTNTIYFDNNTVDGMDFLHEMPTVGEQNVSMARWSFYTTTTGTSGYPGTTSDYNLVQPTAYTATTYDPNEFIWYNNEQGYGYLNTPTHQLSNFQLLTGQDQHSQIADPTTLMLVNMPTTLRWVDQTPTGMAAFTTNANSTTLALLNGAGTDTNLGDFVVGSHIEFDTDGVVRTITAIDPTHNTITFTPALWGYTEGDGLGWNSLPREDYVENWGTRTVFGRNSNLSTGSPGLTMAPGGGPIGSLINIPSYQSDDFTGLGSPECPALPADVQANLQQHNWHLSSWLSFGN